MTGVIAALRMYDFRPLRAAHDALWAALAQALAAHGVEDVPLSLDRSLTHREVWSHPSLLFAQACEYPLLQGLRSQLRIVATPGYSAAGCEGASYRSAIVVRAHDNAESLADLRGQRCAINEMDSNSGMNLLRAAVAPLVSGESRFFSSVHASGSHRRSVELIAAGEADIAAIDCVTFAHLQRIEPTLTAQVRVLTWSPASPCLPFVTSRETSDSVLQVLRSALRTIVTAPQFAPIRETLLLTSVDVNPDDSLSRVQELAHLGREVQL